MKPFYLCLFVVPALWTADALSAQQPAARDLTDGERTALAQAVINSAQMVVQYALVPDDVSGAWGPQDLLDEAEQFNLSPEQRRALEALETRMEQAFFGMLSRMGAPDTTLLPRLWSADPIDPADVVLAGLRLADLETQAILEFAQIQDEMRALLTTEQRQVYLQRTEEVRISYDTANLRSPEEAAAMLAQMADHGMLPHPLLLGRTRAGELGLSPSEQQRLEALHGQLVETLAAVREETRRQPLTAYLPAAELQAVLDTAPPADYVITVAMELLRLRDEAYHALAPDRAEALMALQADLSMRPFRRPPPRACRSGGMGGGSPLADGLDARYSLTFQGDVAHLRSLVIGRGDGGRLRLVDGTPPQHPIRGGGFSMGRWMLSHDEQAGVLWLEEVPVELDGANVVILDMDNVPDGDVPRVAAMLRIDEPIATGGCADAWIHDLMRAFIHEHPELQPYLHR